MAATVRPDVTEPAAPRALEPTRASVGATETAWTPPTWDDVVRQHSARVYRLAYRLTGNQHDAEDLTHDVFVRVFRFDVLSDEAAARIPSRIVGPEESYAQCTMDDDVQRALDGLSPEFRAAVVLCDIEGLSYEEIAATLGVKLGTVRSRIHRGRAQLRGALAHRAPTSPRSRATRLPTLGMAAVSA